MKNKGENKESQKQFILCTTEVIRYIEGCTK